MTTPSPSTHLVTLTLPPLTEHIRLARLLTSGFAVAFELDFEAVEDLRIAVDELCALLVANAGPAQRVVLQLEGDDKRIAAHGHLEGPASSPFTPMDELTRQILVAAVDRFEVGKDDSGPTFTLVKELPAPW